MTWENILKLNYDKYDDLSSFGGYGHGKEYWSERFDPFHSDLSGEGRIFHESKETIEDWLSEHRRTLVIRYRRELSEDYSKRPRSEFPNRALRGIGQMTTPKKIKAGTYIRGKKITEDITVPTEETIKLFNKNLLKRLESLHETLMRKLSNEEIIFYGQVLKKFSRRFQESDLNYATPSHDFFRMTDQPKNWQSSSKPSFFREDGIYMVKDILEDWADIVKEYSLDTIEVEEIIEDVETGTSQTYGKFMGGKPKVTTRMGYGLQEEIDYRKKGEEE